MKVALLGNPNVGKTTVFNSLTGLKQHIGNWPGVTIDKKEGYITKDIKIVDLPGIYAMDTFSNEEKVARNFLENEDVDIIVNIVDVSNLVRNLYLTTQLMQFNKPIILLANMTDVAKNNGYDINYDKLGKMLGVKVLPIVANKNEGIKDIVNTLKECTNHKMSYKSDFANEDETYKYLENIFKNCTSKSKNKKGIGDKVDKILLNPFLAYPIFLLALLMVFKLTFNWLGQPVADMLDEFIAETFTPFVGSYIEGMSPWFQSLILDGIIAGVGGVIVFFPLIFTLFLGMSILEDSGYMSRVAFIMDSVMRKIGLSGKAFIPLMMGLGCSVPAIMATRTLESEKDRKLTALIAPLVSCNARLPVYALFATIFFTNNRDLMVLALYILGIFIAIMIGLLFKSTLFNKDEEPFILELPAYKTPNLKNILKQTWDKSKGFLVKAGTLIFAISVLIWFLTYFNFNGFTEDINTSFLASLGSLIAPIFKPLGFGTWQAGVSILSGLAAKEVVIGTMEIVYGDLNAILPMAFTTVTAISFLVFVSLYTPCVAVLGVMRKEYGMKMMLMSVTYQFILAWIVSYTVNFIGSTIVGEFTIASGIEFLVIIAIVITAIKVALIKFNNDDVVAIGVN